MCTAFCPQEPTKLNEWAVQGLYSVRGLINIVTGCFSSATVKSPCDFHVQMNNLDAGDLSRCDKDARVNEP